MAIRLNELKARTYHLKFNYQGDVLNVDYYPNVVDREFVETMDTLENDYDKIAYQLGKVVQRWDFLDEAGQEIPASDPLVKSLPKLFTLGILNAIIEDINRRAERKKA
jgi:hypothetical protein